jgi:hypothetical protein
VGGGARKGFFFVVGWDGSGGPDEKSSRAATITTLLAFIHIISTHRGVVQLLYVKSAC